MHSAWSFIVTVLVLLATQSGLLAQQPDNKNPKPRNPFGVPDVKEPDSQLVQEYAANARRAEKLTGDPKDANAAPWTKEATVGKKGSIEGEWFERWDHANGAWQLGRGTTTIKQDGDRVFMYVRASNGNFLIELKREKNHLAGRYQHLTTPSDTGPCLFLIVDDERIDGIWSNGGRWDLRRKLK